MIHKAWCSMEEVPYYFSRSCIKFQGHTGWKIDDLDQIWARLLGRSQLSNPSDLPCYFIIWEWEWSFDSKQCWVGAGWCRVSPLFMVPGNTGGAGNAFFSYDQAALRTLLSVRLSVHSSVTPFSLCSHYCIMKFSGLFTNDRSDVHAKVQGRIWPRLGVSRLKLQFEFTNGYEMMHKAWSSIEEVPYCF